MIKTFDPNEIVIRKLQEKDCKIIYLELNEEYLNEPFKKSFSRINNKLSEKIKDINSNDNIYIKAKLDFNATKEDIEIVYDALEMILTGLLSTPQKRGNREQRLGIYSIPKNLNIKISYLLRWVNNICLCNSIGWEVGNKNGFWKKRSIK